MDLSTAALRREIERLKQRIGALSRSQATTDTAVKQQAKRFRISVTATTALLTNVSVNVVWSSPMPSDVYNVDASCSALTTMPAYTVTNQTANGCTVAFTSPSLLAIGTTVVVLGVSPATQ